MKKLLLITTLIIFGLTAANSQPTLKGYIGIKFGSSKEIVRKEINAKRQFKPYKEDLNILSYTGGNYNGHKIIGTIFRFYNDKLHTVIIFLNVEDKATALDNYSIIVDELKTEHKIEPQNRDEYQFPYSEKDGYTLYGISKNNILIESLFTFKDNRGILVTVVPSLDIRVIYQDINAANLEIANEQGK